MAGLGVSLMYSGTSNLWQPPFSTLSLAGPLMPSEILTQDTDATVTWVSHSSA